MPFSPASLTGLLLHTLPTAHTPDIHSHCRALKTWSLETTRVLINRSEVRQCFCNLRRTQLLKQSFTPSVCPELASPNRDYHMILKHFITSASSNLIKQEIVSKARSLEINYKAAARHKSIVYETHRRHLVLISAQTFQGP